MKKFLDALHFATESHRGQKRKYTGEDYIVHPIEVATILGDYLDSVNTDPTVEPQLCAALLHDVIEDCGVSIETIKTMFGNDIAYLVNGLTDVSKPEDGNRKARKLKDAEHIAQGCIRVHRIKCADIISNSKDILDNDPKFAKTYLKEIRYMLELMSEHSNISHEEIYQDAYVQVCVAIEELDI